MPRDNQSELLLLLAAGCTSVGTFIMCVICSVQRTFYHAVLYLIILVSLEYYNLPELKNTTGNKMDQSDDVKLTLADVLKHTTEAMWSMKMQVHFVFP